MIYNVCFYKPLLDLLRTSSSQRKTKTILNAFNRLFSNPFNQHTKLQTSPKYRLMGFPQIDWPHLLDYSMQV